MAQNFKKIVVVIRIVVNSIYGAIMSQCGATKEAAESLIAQLDSQGKLTLLRYENQTIRHENEI
jgi:hypothetical protein